MATEQQIALFDPEPNSPEMTELIESAKALYIATRFGSYPHLGALPDDVLQRLSWP
jgi:hypothetical protein